jgi:hypothetical protein
MLLTFGIKTASMRILTLLFCFLAFVSNAQEQKPFSGKLVYSIQIQDTSLRKMIPIKHMLIFTNDTLIRIENETEQLGIQVMIKHLVLNKSYLLLQTPTGKYAIQTDHGASKIDTFPYSFKKKWGKALICGKKANKLVVKNKNFPNDLVFYYYKNTSVKYLNSHGNFPGLLVKYYLPSADGIYEYTLIEQEELVPPKDAFGIPSDFKKVSFDEFMNEILKKQTETPIKLE